MEQLSVIQSAMITKSVKWTITVYVLRDGKEKTVSNELVIQNVPTMPFVMNQTSVSVTKAGKETTVRLQLVIPSVIPNVVTELATTKKSVTVKLVGVVLPVINLFVPRNALPMLTVLLLMNVPVRTAGRGNSVKFLFVTQVVLEIGSAKVQTLVLARTVGQVKTVWKLFVLPVVDQICTV